MLDTYEEKAAEARKLADRATTEAERKTFEEIAALWRSLAERAKAKKAQD